MPRFRCCSSPRQGGLLLALLAYAAATAPLLPATAQPLDQPSLPPQASAAPASAGSRFVLIRADRQSYDRQRGRIVASGQVLVEVQGWRLWADRLEYDEASRSVWATGQVRLQNGDQYLQASSLRYSDWEASGELLNVYGVIDRDTLIPALRAAPAAANGAPEPAPAVAPQFACPPLSGAAGARQPLQLLPLSRRPLPTIPAPPGCPGADAASRPQPLAEALNEVALGPGLAPPAAPAIPPTPAGEQRVSKVQFQQSFDTSVELNLSAVVDSDDTEENASARGLGRQSLLSRQSLPGLQEHRSKGKGAISRVRFQSSRLTMRGDRWTAAEVAFTNDPFTPANSWTIAKQVSAVLDRPSGVTQIRARSSRVVLDQRLSLPFITNTSIGETDQVRLAIDDDNRDRDGIYLGYNLPPLRLGQKGSLQLQPQLMVKRAIEGKTNSYIAPGASLGSSRVEQSIKAADAFGLDALLNLPVAGMQLDADLSLSTFNPDNIASGTRSIASLRKPLGLSWAPAATASLFGGYRERVYNGSLGLQNLISSYGARLTSSRSIALTSPTPDKNEQPATVHQSPYFLPLDIRWGLQSGNYQANLFQSQELATLWRSNLNLQVGTSLRLWQGQSLSSGLGTEGLRYSPIPVVPGFGLDMGLSGTLSYYGDSTSQNTLSLWGGPSLTLGHFHKPWFDYTRFAIALGGTARSGVSPFGFDRAVDLRTLSFNASQQIYGPLVVSGGASFNIDPDSEFNGEVSYSYIEVKLQRRSYEIGVYYSPYEGIGGIRLRLNDFNFTGTGSPFVPYTDGSRANGGPLSRR